MRAVLPVLILVMLAAMTLSQVIPRSADTIGVDFYNFWGVPTAMRLTGGTVGSPYRDGERYQAVLREYAATVSQPKLKAAQRFWGGPDLTGSPLLYRVFGVVSDDYARSLAVFRALQILAFAGACALLGLLHRLEPFHWLGFALIGLLIYQPVVSDLRVANLGCLQLAALAALLALTTVLADVRSPGRRAALAAGLGVGLAALTLAKPNVALVAAFLAAHVAVRHGARVFALAVAGAAGAGAVLVVLPCLYFGSWSIWLEWYRHVYGADSRALVRPVAAGNYSTPLLASSWLGVDVSLISGALFLALAAALGLAGWLAAGRRSPRAVASRLFRDQHAAAAAAIVLTMAASPLAWVHYYVLMLIPSFWLLGVRARPAVPILAAVSVVMSGGIAGLLLWGLGWAAAMPATIALSWLPLAAALAIKLRSADVAASAPAVAVPVRRRRKRSSSLHGPA